MHSNNVAYQIRAARAAAELSNARRTGYRPRGRVQRLSGVSCGCAPQRLSGYRVVRTLGAYQVVRAVRHGLSGMGAPEEVTAMIPVSDRSAVENAVKLFARAQGRPLAGFQGSEQAQGAASMAATGAKVGSIIPGVGTVIGAVVGAVAGWIMGKKKPVRPSAAEMQQCRTLVAEYQGYAAQSPDAPLPMELPQLKDINWCLNALHGGMIGLKDPRYFGIGIDPVLVPLTKSIVEKIYSTPVGQTVTLDALTFKDPKGRNVHFSGFSFVNPQFTNLKVFSAQIYSRMLIKNCGDTASKKPGCEAYHNMPDVQRWMYDLLAWAARTTLPNISENDLAAASQVAATIPGTSAKDVVTAVESIIKRNVVRDETAALLTPQATSPGAAPAPPIIPTEVIAPLIPAQPPPVAPLPTTAAPTLPGYPSISTLPAPAPIPGAVPIKPAQAGVGFDGGNTWWLVGAGLLGLAFVIPKQKRSRKSRR